jgi:hypothetical protein
VVLEGGVFSSPFEASSRRSARALIHIVTLNDKRLRPPNEVYGEITLLAVDCLWPTFVAGLDRAASARRMAVHPKCLSWSSGAMLHSLNSAILAITSLSPRHL